MTNFNSNSAAAVVTNHTTQKEQPDTTWHYTKISGPEATIISAFIASVVVVSGWIVNHRQTLRSREHTLLIERQARAHTERLARDARLASYEAFLLEWEQRIERSNPVDIYEAYIREAAALFRSRAAEVRRDFPDRVEFNRLDDALSRMQPKDICIGGIHTSRDNLANAIRPLIRYVQAAS
ncbi:MAG: hypothetical protein MUF81_11325 [Verrucomicrobia bacterium]|jgi:hypothetical protein|nr:hypothetical protein [Verrucomicrobiota bacterium]